MEGGYPKWVADGFELDKSPISKEETLRATKAALEGEH